MEPSREVGKHNVQNATKHAKKNMKARQKKRKWQQLYSETGEGLVGKTLEKKKAYEERKARKAMQPEDLVEQLLENDDEEEAQASVPRSRAESDAPPALNASEQFQPVMGEDPAARNDVMQKLSKNASHSERCAHKSTPPISGSISGAKIKHEADSSMLPRSSSHLRSLRESF